MARNYSSTASEMTLVGGITDVAESMQVNSVTGLPVQTPFTLVIDPDQSTEEIVTVTAVAGTTLTVTRGEDGSTAVAHSSGATVRHMATARDFREPQLHIAATTGIHGLGAGSGPVGTTDTQTLTNKSMSGAANSFSNIPQSAVTGLTTALTALDDATDAHVAATAAHGATGAVVGTTNAQTLTNKTLTAPVITAPPANVANPPGAIQLYGAASGAPAGWLVCDGSAVSRTTYADLFTAIGVTYGAGDSTTTFNLPNLKGRVPVGQDATQTEFDTVGETGGAKTHTLTVDEMPSHTHVQDPHTHIQDAHTHTVNDGSSPQFYSQGGATYGVQYSPVQSGSTVATNQNATAVNQNTGGGDAHNNLQPYIVLRYIIKT